MLRLARSRFSLACAALAWGCLILPAAPAAAGTIAGSWHVTGFEYLSDSNPAEIARGPINTSATITPLGGDDYQISIAGDVFTRTLTQSGNLFQSILEDVDEPSSELDALSILWVNPTTLLVTAVNTEFNTATNEHWWFDGLGMVLTTDPIPPANPANWPGVYSLLSMRNDTNDPPPFGFELAPGLVTLTQNGTNINWNNGEGDSGTLQIVNGNLTTTMNMPDAVLYEDDFIIINRILGREYVDVIQLGEGQAVAFTFLAEIAEVVNKQNDQVLYQYLNHGELDVDSVSAVPEPSVYAALLGAGALALACGRRRWRT